MKIISALAFIMILNVFCFLSQTAIANISQEVNPGGEVTVFFDPDNNLLNDFDGGNNTLKDPRDRMPNESATVDPDTGTNWITDIFKTFKNSILDITGLGYVLAIVNAFPNLLTTMNFPPEIVFALGAFWHSLTIFLIVMLLRGNN